MYKKNSLLRISINKVLFIVMILILILIRVLLFVMTDVKHYSLIYKEYELFLNIPLISIFIYLVIKNKRIIKIIALIMTVVLMINSWGCMYTKWCKYPTKRYYFESPMKTQTLLVEVQETYINNIGMIVNVCRVERKIFKKAIWLQPVGVSKGYTISNQWVNEEVFNLTIFDGKKEYSDYLSINEYYK